MLNLFNVSHFSSTACTAAIAKRAQQESGEERATTKSRPMMNLTARMPSVVSSSTSSNPGKTSYGSQDPGKSVASDDRSGKPEKTSWDMMQKVAPHREEPLLGGSAHSARYGEMIHDGSGKPEDTERVFVDKGKTSRSQEIDDKRLHKELGSSDRTGKPVQLSEDIRVMHAHEGTGEPVKSSASTHIVEEQFVPADHRDIASFSANNEFNRATDKENIDFNIPGVPNSTVKRSHGVSVHNLIQRIENHLQRHALQSDLQQHRAFNPFSKESQDVIKAAGNTELCEILDVEPKAQCKVCFAYWDAGIVYCTCGHFLRDDTAENKKYIKSVLDLFSIPNFYIRKGRPHGHKYGKKEGAREYFSANQLRKKCRKRGYSNIHDRFIRDTWFRKTTLELNRTEEVIREMDKLANEDHTHIATEEELNVYRGNWWIRSNFVGSDTMP